MLLDSISRKMAGNAAEKFFAKVLAGLEASTLQFIVGISKIKK